MNNIGTYASIPFTASPPAGANVKGEEDTPASADHRSASFTDALNDVSKSSDSPSGTETAANGKPASSHAGAATLSSPISLSRLDLPDVGQLDFNDSSFIGGGIKSRSSVIALGPEPGLRGEATGAARSFSTGQKGASSWRAKGPSAGQLKMPPSVPESDSKTTGSYKTAKINPRIIPAGETEKAMQAAVGSGAGQIDRNGQQFVNGLLARPMRDASGANAKEIDHRRRTSDDPSAPAASASNTAPGIAGALFVVPVAAASALEAPPDTPESMDRSSVASLSMSVSKDDEGGMENSSHKDASQMKVNVVSHATHFAPVAQLSAAQQIIGGITPTLISFGAAPDANAVLTSSSTAVSAEPGAGTAAIISQPPVKTLDLQLEPESLGSVTIKLNLSSAGLVVDVQTSQAMTANLLEKDKHSLADGLADAGYVVSAVDISAVPQTAVGAGAGDQTAAQNMSGGAHDGAAHDNAGSQGQDSGAQNAPPRHHHPQGSHDLSEPARASARRSAGGLYI